MRDLYPNADPRRKIIRDLDDAAGAFYDLSKSFEKACYDYVKRASACRAFGQKHWADDDDRDAAKFMELAYKAKAFGAECELAFLKDDNASD